MVNMKQKTKKSKGIGINVEIPKEVCEDRHCVFHGHLKIRGRTFEGTVVRAASQKSAVVQWGRLLFIPKYQRYEKRKSKLQVHNPSCVNARVGDKVVIVETKPISKLKHFVIVGRLECKQ